MHNFRELQVWKLAMIIAEEVYVVVAGLPREEKYELASQIRRSAVSVPSNIAEGAGRSSDKEFVYHLNVAMGSAYDWKRNFYLQKSFLKSRI